MQYYTFPKGFCFQVNANAGAISLKSARKQLQILSKEKYHNNKQTTGGFRTYRSFIFLVLPLALSAFTHIWNATGFPDQAPDDGTYIRRALRVIEGLGPQQDTFYDHPYFGQIFLGSIFTLIGYPDIGVHSVPATIQDLERSVGALYTIPRILMGILAVVDTFLIYKITERRYSRNVAFIAAMLFAVTPLAWLFRRMYLDPIQLPFLLTSILFALYTGIRARQKEPKEVVMVKSREDGGGSSEKMRRRERERQGRIVEQVQAEGYNNYNYRGLYEYVCTRISYCFCLQEFFWD